jgi:hypothetical protein
MHLCVGLTFGKIASINHRSKIPSANDDREIDQTLKKAIMKAKIVFFRNVCKQFSLDC